MNIFKTVTFILLVAFTNVSFAQVYSDNWEEYFSYLDIKDISKGNNKIFAAAENAVFVYDLNTSEIETISTINGLSGETISSVYYSENYGLLLIGYENGLMEVVQDNNDDVLTVIDILDKPTIPPTDKEINHFNEVDDVVYISTDYGISVYNLNNLEFGDTYFIGDLGTQIQINQTTIFGEFIYAATTTGIKKALVNSNNLIEYQQWQNVVAGNTIGIEAVNDKLYMVRTNRRIYELINDVINPILTYTDLPVDIRNVDNNLVLTTKKEIFVYDEDFNIIANTSVNETFNTEFTAGIISTQEDIFIGTKRIVTQGRAGFGVLKSSFSNVSELEEIHPQGPLSNKIFSIETTTNELWAVFGGYSIGYDFSGGQSRTGISHLENDEWVNIRYDTIASVVTNPRYLSRISINPNNSDQVFVSSYFAGLIEVNDNQITTVYNQDNSTIVPFAGNIHLGLASDYDDDNDLWVLNGRVESPLNKFSNGNWESYDFSSIIGDPGENLGFSSIENDSQGNLFIGSYSHGVIGVKPNGSSVTIKNIEGESDEGNLPTNYISTLQVDNSNQLWIGTSKGLRVLYNTESLFTDEDPRAEAIIILDEGIANELLFQQSISDIEVDGSNNKWIGTFSTGLYYFSQNGQETIFHFTKDNSPLPSNNISDVSIDDSSGKLYVATDKGLVAFKAGGSKPKTDLENAYVYPNPVRPSFNMASDKVKIKDISEDVNIKITDIEGNLVAEAQSNTNLRYKGFNLEIDGGTAFWNGKNLANNTVASGVYLVFLSDLDTLETKVLKLMVVR